MKISFVTTAFSAPLIGVLLGCGGAAPPHQQMADAQAATRSAEELGASTEPRALLHVKMAREHLAQAKAAMKDDENDMAKSHLMRAKVDAELAIAMMRDAKAQMAADRATDEVEDAQPSMQQPTELKTRSPHDHQDQSMEKPQGVMP